MAGELNVTIVGNLADDPELRTRDRLLDLLPYFLDKIGHGLDVWEPLKRPYKEHDKFIRQCLWHFIKKLHIHAIGDHTDITHVRCPSLYITLVFITHRDEPRCSPPIKLFPMFDFLDIPVKKGFEEWISQSFGKLFVSEVFDRLHNQDDRK